MTAIIYNGKDTYVSPVFAIKNAGWRTQVLAFDADYRSVKRIKMWLPHRQVFIVKWTDFEHSSGAWQGCDWVVNDAGLQRLLRYKKRVSIDQYPKFKEFAHDLDLPEWFEIKTEADITSLMQLSLDFHDATIWKRTRTETDMELLLNTNWGCYITLRFIDVESVDGIERIGMIYDSEMELKADGIRWEITGFVGPNLSSDPYVKCRKIVWNVEIETKLYKRYHRNYPTIEELYDDIKATVPEALFEDGKIVLLRAADRYEIVSKNDRYFTYLNGKKELDDIEDQDIYFDALEFALTSEAEPAEPALWEFSPSNWRTLCHSLKYMSIGLAPWLLLGLIMALTGNIWWNGFFILFGGSAAFALLIGTIVSLRQERMRYIITQTKIRILYPAQICDSDFTDIENIKLCRSVLNKNKGTIKFKVKKGFNANYQFAQIDDIDRVYELLLSLWKNEHKRS
jgi:hypothetical protein